MTNKLILKTLTLLAVLICLFFAAKFIGGAIYHFAAATAVVFIANCVLGYITAAVSITPVGTKSKVPVVAIVLLAAAVSVIAAFFVAGIAGAVGGVLGAAVALLYHRSSF